MVITMVGWFNLSMVIIIHARNQCRYRMNGRKVGQKNAIWYNCNKPRHISKFCRSKNM